MDPRIVDLGEALLGEAPLLFPSLMDSLEDPWGEMPRC